MKRFSLRTLKNNWIPGVVALAVVGAITFAVTQPSANPAYPSYAAAQADVASGDRVVDNERAGRNFYRDLAFPDECATARPDGTCLSEPARANFHPAPAPVVIQPVPDQPKQPNPKKPPTTNKKPATSSGKVNNGPPVNGGGGCAPAVRLPSGVVAAVNARVGACDASMWLWIISHESGGNVHARNSSSGAYGLGQALPASKMAGFGPDYMNNAATQLNWMLSYMVGRYGSIAGAYQFWRGHSWY